MMLLWVTGGLLLVAGGLLTYLLKPHKSAAALLLPVSYCNKGSDQKAPSGRELSP